MAKKKKNITEFQRRVQILEKIMRTGARTEKELLSLSLEQLLRMEDITILDLRDLLEVQRQVKVHALFSWLCTEPESEQVPEASEQEPPAEGKKDESPYGYTR